MNITTRQNYLIYLIILELTTVQVQASPAAWEEVAGRKLQLLGERRQAAWSENTQRLEAADNQHTARLPAAENQRHCWSGWR